MRIAPVFRRYLAPFCLGLMVFVQSGVGAVATTETTTGDAATAALDLPGVAVSAEIGVEGERTSLVFTMSADVEARGFVMGNPDRVIIDLPEVNFQIPPDSIETGGLVASYRFGLFAPGRSRIVIDLAGPARIASIETSIRETDRAAMLTVSVDAVDRAAFEEAVESDSRAALESAMTTASLRDVEAKPGDTRPVIVLDPGHGGIDPGAVGARGVFEKDIVYAFAARLRERLEEGGRYRVILTREGDAFVALGERVKTAQRAQADLFVSIHADSISSAPQVSGLTVYTGSERASDRESERLADRENQADAAAGVEDAQTADDVADILHDLTRRETRGFSHGFAGRLVEEMEGVARLNKNPHRQAGFRVLRAHDVPSVLLELGYLSSQRDIRQLMSEEWRDKATAAMADAIGRYFTTRFANRGVAPVSP
ncbi:MAG TPA: N-acetylmuramoyl-L-alanine amidase [Saliniramus sp.]|nr:N-acetylmuramoyl-L-alanine amidase [Saliniramus sp.]